MYAIRKIALAGLCSLSFVAPVASAGGIIDVFNESEVLIQPYFKSNCWGWLRRQRPLQPPIKRWLRINPGLPHSAALLVQTMGIRACRPH